MISYHVCFVVAQVLAIVDRDKAFLETLEGGGGCIRSLEDLAWAETPSEMNGQEQAAQKVTFGEVGIDDRAKLYDQRCSIPAISSGHPYASKFVHWRDMLCRR